MDKINENIKELTETEEGNVAGGMVGADYLKMKRIFKCDKCGSLTSQFALEGPGLFAVGAKSQTCQCGGTFVFYKYDTEKDKGPIA